VGQLGTGARVNASFGLEIGTGGDLGEGGSGGRPPRKLEVGDGSAYIPQYFVNIITNCTVFVCYSFRD